MGELVGFRVVQGLGAGGIAVTAFALIRDLVPPRERGRYQGMIAVVVAIGTVGGPLLGGFVTGTLGWRWAFYLNIPLGLLALGWCALFLHVPVTRRRARIDVAGIATLALTITSMVLLTTWAGSQYPWLSLQIVGLAVLAMGSAAAFARAESRTVEPVLPLRLFAERNFTSANVLAMVVGAVMFGTVLYLPLFQQSVQGATAASSGLLLLPLMVPVVVVTTLVGRTMSATGRYKIFPVIGTVLITAAAVGLSTMTVGTSRLTTSLFMVVLGLGMGCVQQMTTVIAQNSAPTADLGAAPSAVTMSRTIGASVGVAVFGSLFTRATLDQVPGSTGYLTGVASGTHGIFLTAAVLGVVGVAAAAAIVEVPLRSGPAPQEPHQGQASTTPAAPVADLRLTRPARRAALRRLSTRRWDIHDASSGVSPARRPRGAQGRRRPRAPRRTRTDPDRGAHRRAQPPGRQAAPRLSRRRAARGSGDPRDRRGRGRRRGRRGRHGGGDRRRGDRPRPGSPGRARRTARLDRQARDHELAVRWGSTVVAVHPLGQGRHRVELADGQVLTTNLLVGADGAWSQVRPLLSTAHPAYSGVSFVESDLLGAATAHPATADLAGTGLMFAFGEQKGFITHLETDGSIHAYVARKGGEDWLSTIDFSDRETSKAAVLEHFEGWDPRLRELIAGADGALVPRPIHALSIGHSWQRVPGVTLLGDAAHVMSPFAGEGVNLAMIDGTDLAAALIEHVGDVEAALAAYEKVMFPRARSSAQESADSLEMMFGPTSPQPLLDMFSSFDHKAAG